MQVDTGSFRALTDQVAELAEQIRELKVWDVEADLFYAAGFARGEAAAREAMLGRAAETSRKVSPRPSHLRSVDGGQP